MATNYTAKPRKNESMERFIKRFTKKCKKLGIMQEMRDNRHFVSESEKRRLSKKKAIARKNKKK
jgi:small subunit ribosomal protein S21